MVHFVNFEGLIIQFSWYIFNRALESTNIIQALIFLHLTLYVPIESFSQLSGSRSLEGTLHQFCTHSVTG